MRPFDACTAVACRMGRSRHPEIAPRVVQAFQMAAQGAMYDEIVAATGICRNKSSLATILANPIYRGVKVFNRETRVSAGFGVDFADGCAAPHLWRRWPTSDSAGPGSCAGEPPRRLSPSGGPRPKTVLAGWIPYTSGSGGPEPAVY
jgi:hypothetical protein